MKLKQVSLFNLIGLVTVILPTSISTISQAASVNAKDCFEKTSNSQNTCSLLIDEHDSLDQFQHERLVSADGTRFFSSGSGNLILSDSKTGETVATIRKGHWRAVSPFGPQFVTSRKVSKGSRVTLWSLQGKEISQFESEHILKPHAFVSADRVLFQHSVFKNKKNHIFVSLYNIKTGVKVREWAFPDDVPGVSKTYYKVLPQIKIETLPNTTMALLLNDEGTLYFFNYESPNAPQFMGLGREDTSTFSVSPSGRHLAVYKRQENQVYHYGLPSLKALHIFRQNEIEVESAEWVYLKYSLDDQLLLVGGNRRSEVFEVKTDQGTEKRRRIEHKGVTVLWRLTTFEKAQVNEHFGTVYGASFTPDGKSILTMENAPKVNGKTSSLSFFGGSASSAKTLLWSKEY